MLIALKKTVQTEPTLPLCVDLDGTLVKSDTLIECALRLVKSNPLIVFQMVLWLRQGKAVLKREVVARSTLDPTMFPYNEDVLEFVRKAKGTRQCVLVTGSDQTVADYVAEDTQLFDLAQGSDGRTNLTSHRKREWLVNEFGVNGFDYIGNDKDDIAVWADSNKALLAGDAANTDQFSGIEFDHEFRVEKPSKKDFLSLMRVHQWSKNALIFIPFLLDKTVQTWPNLLLVVLAFFVMSLLASMTYIVNDMLDLSADRLNDTKKNRALASCRVPLMTGGVVALILLLVVCLLAMALPHDFNLILLLYLVSTLYYSFELKRRIILDVCTIAVLHTIRIVAGILAVGAVWSFWLLAFSMFIFFSLAVAKRVSELMNLKVAEREASSNRGYLIEDIPVLSAMGISTSFISVLVIALFIHSEKVAENYSQPILLWLLCPLLMYWIGRLWIITGRGELHEDPIVFALKDRLSIYVVAAVILVFATAAFL